MHVSDAAIARHFIRATKDVLSTMAGLSPEEGKPFVKNDGPQEGDISAVIGLTGSRKGTISVSFDRVSARLLLHGMLGDDVGNEADDLEDVVGEISNMISGQARAGLVSEGLELHGSTPTVVTGDGHGILHSASGPSVAIPFSLGQCSFTVEFSFDAEQL